MKPLLTIALLAVLAGCAQTRALLGPVSVRPGIDTEERDIYIQVSAGKGSFDRFCAWAGSVRDWTVDKFTGDSDE